MQGPHNDKKPEIGKKHEHPDHCMFCNKHKFQVPLLATSPVSVATICTYCAIVVIQQTLPFMVQLSAQMKALMKEYPEIFERDTETGGVKVVAADQRLDAAIESTGSGEKQP